MCDALPGGPPLYHHLFLPHLEDHEWEHLTNEGMHASGMKEALIPEYLIDTGSMSEEKINEIPTDAEQDALSAMRTTHWSGSLTSSSTGSAWVRGLQQLHRVHPCQPACATMWGLTTPHIGGGVLALITCWNKL
jgi:hypothetical protein